jgi:hypothetical protein
MTLLLVVFITLLVEAVALFLLAAYFGEKGGDDGR